MRNKIIISLAFAALFTAGGIIAGPASAETKKDVSDPVLGEVIQSFSARMPRFIDKHGKELFVADAPLTRGGLMLALYEYDKSLKTPKNTVSVTRAEFDQLSSRLSLIETGSDKRVRAHDETAKAPVDTMQIINDLMPNMPVLLDNSLNNSKVFAGLRDEVMNRKAQPDGALSASLDQTRNELRELSKKVDTMEKASGQESPVAQTEAAPQYMKKDLLLTRAQLSKLEKRVNDIEERKEPEKITVVRTEQGDVKQYTSMLAKISMGLSMVAALFIAR